VRKPIRFSTIGAFVFGAFVILFSSIIFLGSGEIFKSSREYVLFFDQSVNGLPLGAPVKFRGVVIGIVSRMNLSHTTHDEHPKIAVFIQLHENPRTPRVGEAFNITRTDVLEDMVQKGLRAQLKSQSILSGELYLSLDMLPNEPIHYYLPRDNEIPEIPTAKSGLIEDLTANSVDVTKSLTGALENLQRVLLNIDKKLDPVADESIEALKEMRATMSSVRDFIDPDAPLGYQLPKSLAEIEGAAKSIRQLADYLERNPSSVVFGRSRVEEIDRQ
jgi:paraquat-inducible protein B